jgi:hypothetical protein
MWVWLLVGCLIVAAAYYYQTEQDELKLKQDEVDRKEEELKVKEQETIDAAAAVIKAKDACNAVMRKWVIEKNWAIKDSANSIAECKGQPSRSFSPLGVWGSNFGLKLYWGNRNKAWDMIKLP